MPQRDSRGVPPALASWLAAMAMAALCFLSVGRAAAAVNCAPTGVPGVERCVAGLAPAMLQRMYQVQEASNWCWAASVSMVLRRYGLQVGQEQVVRTQLGRAENWKVPAEAIGEILTRSWDDGAGRRASSSVTPLPPWRRALGLAAPEVLDDLAQGRPLLVETRDHAMVLVQVLFERRTDRGALGPAGVRVLRAAVLDPASALRLRPLAAGEQPAYVARVRVQVDDAPAQVAALGPTGRAAQ